MVLGPPSSLAADNHVEDFPCEFPLSLQDRLGDVEGIIDQFPHLRRRVWNSLGCRLGPILPCLNDEALALADKIEDLVVDTGGCLSRTSHVSLPSPLEDHQLQTTPTGRTECAKRWSQPDRFIPFATLHWNLSVMGPAACTVKSTAVNRWDVPGQGPDRIIGTDRVRTYRDVLDRYRVHPEDKFLGPDGQPCRWETVGLLQRRPVHARPRRTSATRPIAWKTSNGGS